MKLIDLTGRRFGRLVAIRRAQNKNNSRHAQWHCKCDCGIKVVVDGATLRNGATSSCGCFRSEKLRALRTTHGLRDTPEYLAWADMRTRCLNPARTNYPNYGGRGIKVCRRWTKFENFIADMGRRPSPQHTVERQDVNGNYSPKNCIWLESHLQSRNQRRTVLSPDLVAEVRKVHAVGGNVAAWARAHGIKPVTAHAVTSGRTWVD